MNYLVKIVGVAIIILTVTKIYCNNDDREIVHSIIQLTYNADYDSARKKLNMLKNGEINSLQIHYFKAMIIWRQDLILGSVVKHTDETKRNFEKNLNLAISKGEKILQKNEKDSIALFFTGAAYGSLAQYYARVNGSYFKAASLGKQGLDLHEKLLSLYPRVDDAYYSLGLFNYLASSVSWYLKPVLYILGRSGSESKAYTYLNATSIKGNFAKFEAMETLAELYTENKKYHNADSIYKELKIQFPNNSYYYYFTYLKILYSSGANKKFFKIGDEVLNQLKLYHSFDDSQKRYIALIFLTISLKYEKEGKIQKAIDIYSEFLDKKLDNAETNSWFLFSRGKLYESIGKNSEAIIDYEIAIKQTNNQNLRNSIQSKLNKLN